MGQLSERETQALASALSFKELTSIKEDNNLKIKEINKEIVWKGVLINWIQLICISIMTNRKEYTFPNQYCIT